MRGRGGQGCLLPLGELLPAQQLEHQLGLLVGLREHGSGALVDDLRAGKLGGGGRVVGILDAANAATRAVGAVMMPVVQPVQLMA